MDILTHTLSGLAVGTVVSSFSNSGFKSRLKIVLISGFAGAIPDLDAISLWSGFDTTIGRFFNLSASGKEIYSAKYWYSHHAFMHSALAGVILTAILGHVSYLLAAMNKAQKSNPFLQHLKEKRYMLIAFFLGFLIHLIEDMPTPASSWGGINLFWPSQSYIGGSGDIWWWNNYDIFLIVLAVIVINLSVSLIRKFVDFDARKFTVAIFILGLSLSILQMKSRKYDFAYSGYAPNYQELEAQSKENQKEILGNQLFQIMENFDNKLPFYF
ncbi:metal-dependent hydrolase [Marinifilum caeruleilacunae]|uniref:Metal-dependent hydrolase n=1 Tax=Marinifilum caeruleilacunae TaxID=2499076 RepID=A0ABX1WUN8_9BACT|nr:metal-dependent hydrolase [Marinifilum caeruleilacunae]NOU59644.1 metal-dependent hydrolase [Marinifilum caeruleilacunae]